MRAIWSVCLWKVNIFKRGKTTCGGSLQTYTYIAINVYKYRHHGALVTP